MNKTNDFRKEVWIRAWCAVVQRDDSIIISSAKRHADDCLEYFDKKFPKDELKT